MKSLCEKCSELDALTLLLPTKEHPRLGTAVRDSSGSKDGAYETSSRGGDESISITAIGIKLYNITLMRQFRNLEECKKWSVNILPVELESEWKEKLTARANMAENFIKY